MAPPLRHMAVLKAGFKALEPGAHEKRFAEHVLTEEITQHRVITKRTGAEIRIIAGCVQLPGKPQGQMCVDSRRTPCGNTGTEVLEDLWAAENHCTAFACCFTLPICSEETKNKLHAVLFCMLACMCTWTGIKMAHS
jgi:hypothetical protein